MKRILFVDDAELLLELYGVMLSKEQGRWEIKTAKGGEEALKLMKAAPFDVVASDMRMPGMDGVQLLNQVGQLYPQTARIMISGLDEKAFVADSLRSTHQFIAKPVNASALKATLVRISGLDSYLKDEKLKELAGRLETLPSFPALYLEIMQAIESPDSSLKSIADIIVKDPGLMAKMLQVVNSTAFGLQEKIHDPVEAVRQLGMDTIRSLALSSHVFSNFTPAQMKNFSVDALWTHLMKCGDIARLIMQSERAPQADIEDAYTAGILHDIGKLMLADSLPDEFQRALALAAERKVPLHAVEMEIFGATHAGLAAYLLGLWGLPAPIVEAVAFHHTPEKTANSSLSPLTAVHVANAFEHELAKEDSGLNQDYIAAVGAANRLGAWHSVMEEKEDWE
jgi:HD-like signal output (HDOD) protein